MLFLHKSHINYHRKSNTGVVQKSETGDSRTRGNCSGGGEIVPGENVFLLLQEVLQLFSKHKFFIYK